MGGVGIDKRRLSNTGHKPDKFVQPNECSFVVYGIVDGTGLGETNHGGIVGPASKLCMRGVSVHLLVGVRWLAPLDHCRLFLVQLVPSKKDLGDYEIEVYVLDPRVDKWPLIIFDCAAGEHFPGVAVWDVSGELTDPSHETHRGVNHPGLVSCDIVSTQLGPEIGVELGHVPVVDAMGLLVETDPAFCRWVTQFLGIFFIFGLFAGLVPCSEFLDKWLKVLPQPSIGTTGGAPLFEPDATTG